MKDHKRLIVIADSHLGIKEGDVEKMIRFLETLDPDKEEILFLGDLFHIWAAPSKYHTDRITLLLDALRQFQERDGKAHLTVGNRDIFFVEQKQGESKGKKTLPFYTIAREFSTFQFSRGSLVATHGDLVNSQDKQYLRWRKIVRHPLFRLFFNLLPNGWVKKTMTNLEVQLKKTNMEFRQEFPMEEWKQFLQNVHEQYDPGLLLVGHFHPKRPIVSSHETTIGIVVPDWYRDCSYLSVSSDLNHDLLRFDG